MMPHEFSPSAIRSPMLAVEIKNGKDEIYFNALNPIPRSLAPT